MTSMRTDASEVHLANPKNADRFIKALEKLEQAGETDELVALFAPDAEITNLGVIHLEQGQGGAERFWRDYRSQFQQIRTRFARVIETGETVVFEWSSEGRLASGRPLTYYGVTMVDFK